MSINYVAPVSTNLPFNFTGSGYTVDSRELLFRFKYPSGSGNLQAAINVMHPYWYETYTYPKTCPKYVVGYRSGRVQILQGRCTYGGIRDIRGIIKGWQISNLLASLAAHDPIDISAYVHAFQTSYSTLLSMYLHTFQTSSSDIAAYTYGWQTLDLPTTISTHLPGNIKFILRPWYLEVPRNLQALSYGWQTTDIRFSFSGTHDPVDISAHLTARQHGIGLLPASTHAWHEKFLSAAVHAKTAYAISASIYPILAGELLAFIKSYPQEFLSASTRGWGGKDLGAYLNQILSYDLGATINGSTDMFRNLISRIVGVGFENRDLSGSILPFYWDLLSASIRAKYLGYLGASLVSVRPKYLPALLHAYTTLDLQGIILGQAYPYNLVGIINSVGSWYTLSASIMSKQDTRIYRMLPAVIHPWEVRYLSAYLQADRSYVLGASISSLGYVSNLRAAISPRMIRLTTVVNISTLANKNLSATINYPCFKTGYSYLNALLYGRYKGDLYAFIRPLMYDYKPATLSASIGWADSYTVIDKFKISVIVKNSSYFVEDKYRLFIKTFDGGNLLNAYVRGTLRYTGLNANVVGEELASYTFDSYIKNRETAIYRTYDGVFKSFETIEMSFKSIVKDYYYSPAGDYAWSKDVIDKWVLDVRTYLPANTKLKLKRRLHKATNLYDLRKFTSVDEAMRFAIAYVTEYPQNDLMAYVNSINNLSFLGGIITPMYQVDSNDSLGASITPSGFTVILGLNSSVSKL